MSHHHEISSRSRTDPTHNRSIHRRFTDEQQMALSTRHALVAARTDDKAIIERIRMDPNGRVIALDIDECSVIGADTYDILRLVQKLTDNFQNETSQAHLLDIARNLINPNMIQAVNHIRKSTPHPFVVFYTLKGGILRFFTGNTDERIRYQNSGILNEQGTLLHFRSGDVIRERWAYLNNQIRRVLHDLPQSLVTPLHEDRKCLELYRIGILTWAASIALGLSYSAPVFITSIGKNMDLIESILFNEQVKKSFLFDDKAGEHASNLQSSLEVSRMIEVEPYTHSRQSEANANELFTKLNAYFSITDSRRAAHLAALRMSSQAARDWPAQNLVIAPDQHSWAQHTDSFTRQPQQPWDYSRVVHGITRSHHHPIHENTDEMSMDHDLHTLRHMDPAVRSLSDGP